MVLPALSSAESLNETAKKKVSDSCVGVVRYHCTGESELVMLATSGQPSSPPKASGANGGKLGGGGEGGEGGGGGG